MVAVRESVVKRCVSATASSVRGKIPQVLLCPVSAVGDCIHPIEGIGVKDLHTADLQLHFPTILDVNLLFFLRQFRLIFLGVSSTAALELNVAEISSSLVHHQLHYDIKLINFWNGSYQCHEYVYE